MQEQEAKFFLSDRTGLETRLKAQGAVLVTGRVHERNLRFDTPDRRLASAFQVLRLRQDDRVRLTYKAAGEIVDGVRARPEIEFEAGDFEAAQAFLEALGYEVSFEYEKFRTTWHFEEMEVVLDETPLGDFAEIEGRGGIQIEAAARRLGLDWGARINESYAFLFEAAKLSLGLSIRDMTFENFAGLRVSGAAMGIRFADPPHSPRERGEAG